MIDFGAMGPSAGVVRWGRTTLSASCRQNGVGEALDSGRSTALMKAKATREYRDCQRLRKNDLVGADGGCSS
jgi:hypothetical protein